MYFNPSPIAFSVFINTILKINSLAVNFKVNANGWAPNEAGGNWVRGTAYIQNYSTDFLTIGDILLFGENGIFVGKIFHNNGNIGIKRWYKISDTFQ